MLESTIITRSKNNKANSKAKSKSSNKKPEKSKDKKDKSTKGITNTRPHSFGDKETKGLKNQPKESSLNLNAFHCGCGILTEDPSEFKTHVINEHDGVCLNGSSHYISFLFGFIIKCGKIDKNSVLEVKESNQKIEKKETLPNRRNRKSLISKKIMEPKNQIIASEDENANKIAKIPDSECIEKKGPRRRSNLARSKSPKPKIKQQEFGQEAFQFSPFFLNKQRWNGFLLAKNPEFKNSNFSEKYFCGVCSNGFNQRESYILHCLQECEEVQNPLSSHSIEVEDEQKQRERIKKLFINHNPLKKISEFLEDEFICSSYYLKKNTQVIYPTKQIYCGHCQKNFCLGRGFVVHMTRIHELKNHPNSSYLIFNKSDFFTENELNALEDKRFQENAQQQKVQEQKVQVQKVQKNPVKAYPSIELLFRQMMEFEQSDEQRIHFICACGEYATDQIGKFLLHSRKHGEIIPENSSHILCRLMEKKFPKYIAVRNREEDPKMIPKIFCPCNLDKKLSRNDFIKHIFKIHKGISPIYETGMWSQRE